MVSNMIAILSLIHVVLVSGEFGVCQTLCFCSSTTFISCTITMQVQVSNKDILQRYHHSAASLPITPECVEVALFGGHQKSIGLRIAGTVALRFGED